MMNFSNSRLGKLWASFWRPTTKYSMGALLLIGVLGGAAGLIVFQVAMANSNTEEFCLGCHEMKIPFEEYKETVHYQPTTGVRATCPDCHVPKPWIHKLVAKVRATKDIYHKFLGTINTEEKYEDYRLHMAEAVWKRMEANDSRECRSCHDVNYMALDDQGRRARKNHKKVIAGERTCINCHKGIAHKLPKGVVVTKE